MTFVENVWDLTRQIRLLEQEENRTEKQERELIEKKGLREDYREWAI